MVKLQLRKLTVSESVLGREKLSLALAGTL